VNEPLQKLAELLGIPGDLHIYENAEEWKYYGDANTVRLATVDGFAAFAAFLPELRKDYGDALSLSFKNGGWTEFEMNAAKPNEPLDDLQKAIDAASALTLDVKIDKAVLAAKRNLTDAAVATRLFLFAESLVRALSVPLTDFDEELFRNVLTGQKLVILIESYDIHLDGPWLAIVGRKAMTEWRNSIGEPPGEPPILALARVKTNRLEFRLNRLTPLHLIVRVKQAADGDPIASALHAQLFLCSVLYLAQRSTWDAVARVWTCTFAADRQETDVRLAAPVTTSETEWEAARTLGELARWGYETDRLDDRLIVLQRTFVDALQNNSADTNGTEILRLAPELSKRVRWGWEAFISGELKKYIEQVKTLEETVAGTAKDYNEQVGALAATVIANMLGAVGVILGSFLAAIFKSPFEAYAFRFGTIVYVIYLLVFPMGVGLTATWQRFRKSRETFDARKRSFAQRLREEPVRKITETILGRSESWFRKWYFASVAMYMIVVAVLIAAIVLVPPAIERWNGNPDDFVLRSASRNQPVNGVITIRGEHFDKEKDIVVTLGHTTFTNAADPVTLKVYGTTALTLMPQKSDLAANIVTVRQGAAGPKSVALR
jgi:hypothetical protein